MMTTQRGSDSHGNGVSGLSQQERPSPHPHSDLHKLGLSGHDGDCVSGEVCWHDYELLAGGTVDRADHDRLVNDHVRPQAAHTVDLRVNE